MRRPLPVTVKDFLSVYDITGAVFDNAVETYQLGDILDRPVHGLSGGQLQRVLLAQAVAHDPDLILMDEPTAGLDISSQEEFYRLVDVMMDRP